MTQTNQPDDDLRALLRQADPAASLTPLEPDRITRMVNQTTSQSPSSSSPRRSPRRSLLLGLAGAAGVAAVAFAAVSALTPSATTVTRIGLPAGGDPATSMCMAISADLLAPADLAFEATATEVVPDLVTLQVTEVFAGDPGQVVELAPVDPMDADFSGFTMVEGGSYLIATFPDEVGAQQVALCGLSGPADPQLRAVYEEAFR